MTKKKPEYIRYNRIRLHDPHYHAETLYESSRDPIMQSLLHVEKDEKVQIVSRPIRSETVIFSKSICWFEIYSIAKVYFKYNVVNNFITCIIYKLKHDYRVFKVGGHHQSLMIVITLSFIIIANYQYSELNPLMSNIFVIATVIYLVVFLKAFAFLYRRVMNGEFRVKELTREKNVLKKDFISVRVNRENHQIYLEKVIYLENFADYVKIHTTLETQKSTY